MEERLGTELQKALGGPTLTMVAERGETRHILAESALIAAALWLVKKYLDGFLGEPIQDLGRRHREKLVEAAQAIQERLQPDGEPPEREQIDAAAALLSDALEECAAAGVSFDSSSGREAVARRLRELGLPDRAAERKAADLESALRALVSDA